jgi:hypothetical protein
MTASDLWASKGADLGLFLQRKFWKPLRSMMNIFHVLPLAAATILFVLLATDGQFREIYITYLEGVNGNATAWIAGVVIAMVALALISVILYEAHYALSTMRLNIVYSSSSNPEAASRLRKLQSAAAFVLAFLPWFGLTTGLFGARNFVADRYCQLLNIANVAPDELHDMQYLPLPSGWTIAYAVILLGVAVAYFSSSGEQNRLAQRAVACFAPPMAALLFLLFTNWLNTKTLTAGVALTWLIIIALTAIYFWIHERLYRRRSGFVFMRTSGIGVSLRKRRGRLLAIWAFMPWFFLSLYFAIAQYLVPSAGFVDDWSDCPVAAAPGGVPIPGHWAAFPVAMCYTISIGLFVGHLLGRFSASKRRRIAICFLVAALAATVELVAFLGSANDLVAIYRFIGPLGTVFLQLLFLISTFALLAALSQRSGFPALTLIILAVVIAVMFPNYAGWTVLALGIVCVVSSAMAFVSGRFALAGVLLLLPVLGWVNSHKLQIEPVVEQNAAQATADSPTLKLQFACWLASRGVTASGQQQANCSGNGLAATPPSGAARKKYPVFIVAAEGGGIYAASAASTLLARLQEVAPNFDAHVFAISAVSGGSIGAAIFQALDHATHPDAAATPAANDPACVPSLDVDQSRTDRTLTQKAANITEGDHFSPVVASIFPEIFGSPLQRSDALVASFENSTAAQDAVAGRDLCAPFAQHWSTTGVAPALILNSTWVETGFRVAFAPFHLHDLDESLYSFSDPSMPHEDCPTIHNKQSCVSLMQAATVSARFPFILPPFSATMPDGKHWNFVDGAYSDNSGASTALDIYRALEDVAPQSVDLRIILLTSSDPQPNLAGKDINGTVFRDTLAPIDAIMKVREDLGDAAVARACTYVYQEDPRTQTGASAQHSSKTAAKKDMEVNETCVDHAGGRDGPLQIVEIQDQTYGLALGWKISKTSFAVVSWMLGRPEKCAPQKPPPSNDASSQDQSVDQVADSGNAQLTDTILQRNSCVMKLIVELVAESSAPASNENSPTR